MALFDKMKDSISVAGQGVSQKAKTATESVRISNLIKGNERMIEKLTYQVGVQCVERHSEELNSEYSELFAEIRRLREENQRCRVELQQLSAGNVCPQCGFSNNTSAKFCISCGAPLSAAPAGGKKCGKCGYINAEDAAFCVECGSPMLKEEPAVNPVPPVVEVPVAEESFAGTPVTEEELFGGSVPEAEGSFSGNPSPAEASDTGNAPAEEAQAVSRCKNCGAVLDDSCLFCTECGTKRVD